MKLVEWSLRKDNEGKQMVEICGGYYPQNAALMILKQLKELLKNAKED